MYDYIIIGAGIIGSLTAYELSKQDAKVLLIEKNSVAGIEQTMSNSAINHCGVDPKDDTLKMQLNLQGHKMLKQLCIDLDCHYNECGALLISNENQVDQLKEIYERAKKRSIKCDLLNKEQLKELEPNISKDTVLGLSMPTTAVINPVEITKNALEVAKQNGVNILYDIEVRKIFNNTVTTDTQNYQAKVIINATGIYANNFYSMQNPSNDIQTILRKGAYYVISKNVEVVSRVIYPMPTNEGKGVLAVPTTHGNTLIGPSVSTTDDFHDDSVYSDDLLYINERVENILSNLDLKKSIHTYAGIRSSINKYDFQIINDNNIIHLIGIDSPGLSASPAIAKYAYDICMKIHPTNINKYYKTKYSSSSTNKNSRIVCRCELVTEQEIVEAIRYKGARTVMDIKYQLRPLMGECQGSFCEAEIVNILSRELNVAMEDIVYRNNQEKVLYKTVKGPK